MVFGFLRRVGRGIGRIARGAVNVGGRVLSGINRGVQFARNLPVVGGLVRTAMDATPIGQKIQRGLNLATNLQRGASRVVDAVDRRDLRGGIQAVRDTARAGRDVRDALRRNR